MCWVCGAVGVCGGRRSRLGLEVDGGEGPGLESGAAWANGDPGFWAGMVMAHPTHRVMADKPRE